MYPRIRDLREDHDLTQKKLAEILHCSQRIYSDYERGKCNIPLTLLVDLANLYDVSIDYMLSRTDNPRVNR
ncbi:MAG: helix-turn-helix transcriptional regulator [Clostridia bacterium]|nr:helix-turn-helix transcriptional regulator [Clostridia bacterium]